MLFFTAALVFLCSVDSVVSSEISKKSNATYCQVVNSSSYDEASNQLYGDISLNCTLPDDSEIDVVNALKLLQLSDGQTVAVSILCSDPEMADVYLPWYPDWPHLIYVKVKNCWVYQCTEYDEFCFKENNVDDIEENRTDSTSEAVSNIEVLTLINCVVNDIYINNSRGLCDIMPNLRTLTIRNSVLDIISSGNALQQLNDSVKEELPSCSLQLPLRHVDFSYNYWFSEAFIQYLLPYKRLKSIDLTDTAVNGRKERSLRPLFHIGTFPEITSINLSLTLGGSSISRFVDNRAVKDPIVHIVMHNIVNFFLSPEDLDAMKKLNGIMFDIHHDYLACPHHKAVIGALLANEEIFQPGAKYHYVSLLECFKSDNVTSEKIQLSKLHKYCFYCLPMSRTTIAVIVILAVVIGLLLVSLPLSIRYRGKLLVLLHWVKISISPQKFKLRKCVLHLSYDKNDYYYVKSLVDKLECEFGYTVYLQSRNATPGEAEIDEIVGIINKAHYTVLLCSSSFITNDWCVTECRQAFFRMVHERRNYLVAILLEDIANIFGTHQQKTANIDEDNENLADIHWCVRNCSTISKNSFLFWPTLIYKLRKPSDQPVDSSRLIDV